MKTDELLRRFKDKSLRIGVLMGGFSSEREISLKSGNAVNSALAAAGYKTVPIDVKTPSAKGVDSTTIDAAFIAMHGEFGEDGQLQELLEARGIPYTGSGPEGSRNAMDKFASKRLFLQHGVSTAEFITVSLKQPMEEIFAQVASFGLPVVVKPRSEGSSVGVSIVKSPDKIGEAITACRQYQDEAIAERFIEGREVTVGILGDKALPLIELVPRREFFDYIAKYKDDRTEYVVNPRLEPAVVRQAQEQGLKAFNALGCRHFARVDMMVRGSDQRCFVLEVNSIPGLTERSLLPKAAQAIGVSFAQLCEQFIEMAVISFGFYG